MISGLKDKPENYGGIRFVHLLTGTHSHQNKLMTTPLRVTFFAFFALVFVSANAQLLPTERRTDWTLAGIRDELTTPTTFINFFAVGGKSDGKSVNDSLIQALLSKVGPDGAVIYFPKGRYYFTKSISLPSKLHLTGSGSDSTQLIFDLGEEKSLIEIKGEQTSIISEVTADLSKDSFFIPVADATLFNTGDFIRLSDNDASLVSSGWALNSCGQITKIKHIEGNYLYLESPLRRSYAIIDRPKVQKLLLKQNCSIENLGIERLDTTRSQTSNILFELAANCRIKCVESNRCNFAHVEVSSGTNIDITGSYFHEAFSYGGGGKGYGIALQYTTGETRITGNTFKTLRHSILLQAGANGNVISYNYSLNPTWDEGLIPKNYAGDIVLHGNYPYANLFEGNVVQNIVIDNSHGRNGPHNTFFRNRACLYGILISDKACAQENFIGNELTNSVLGNYFLQGTNHYEYGNNLSGKLIPAGTAELPVKSLYLDAVPDYYSRRNAWPPVGTPNALNGNSIEAEELFNKGYATYCIAPADVFGDRDTIPNDTTTLALAFKKEITEFKIYPNPARNYIQVDAATPIKAIRILTMDGRLMQELAEPRIDISHLAAGPYLVQILLPDGRSATRKLIVFRQ
jgi:hypothetical protein